MWYSENHRNSVKVCSPTAYVLASIGEALWLLALPTVLLGSLGFLILGFRYSWSYSWLLVIPAAMALTALLMRGLSEHILDSRGYKYDYEPDRGSANGEEIKI